MTDKKRKFLEWCNELDKMSIKHGFPAGHSCTMATGAENWVHYFNDGYTPEEAVLADLGEG